MAQYDFSYLESKFPEIVKQMPDRFDSHEFLLALAHQNQAEYVKALYANVDYVNQENPSPFQIVHSVIMKKLKHHTELVTLLRDDKPSKDIFGKSQTCGEWEKV